MADYLERIAAAKSDIARLKGEKEAFEPSNVPDDVDEEELANWNYAKDLDRQMRELKAEHKDTLKGLAKLEKAVNKISSGKGAGVRVDALAEARASLQPVLDRLVGIEAELVPYEHLKEQLTEARARYRKLIDAFVGELKNRCGGLGEDEKRALVLELFAQDVQAGLDAAVAEKRQHLMDFLTNLWDKSRVSLTQVSECQGGVQAVLDRTLREIGYA